VAAHLPKGNETPPTLVPKYETRAAEALKKRESVHAAKLGMVAERPCQAIVGNPAAQVVHMVHSNVGSEPAKDSRQIIMRASVQSRLVL
jgi:hypothetical protein